MAYYLDYWWAVVNPPQPYSMNTLTNLDYFISTKAFFFDLYFFDDETPNDDTSQPLGTDLATVMLLMKATYDNNA